MRPLNCLRDSEDFTVPRGLKSLVDQFGFLGQRHFVQAIATTGSKG